MDDSSSHVNEKNSVAEAIKTAENYKDELQQLLVELEEINSQVTKSAEKSISEIETTFKTFLAAVLSSIEDRKQELVTEVRGVRDEAIDSLNDCKTIVDGQMKTTSDVLNLGKKIVGEDGCISDDDLAAFNDRCYKMRCLPDVSCPSDVPFIAVRFNRSIVGRILNKVSNFGRISVMGPVQIVESKEKPGALAIRWEEDEVRACCDPRNRKYRLQRCRGDARLDESAAMEFADVYVGHETCYVVRDLRPGVNYSFRVSHYGSEECEWSVPYVAKTHVPSYEWYDANDGYSLNDFNRIATKVSNGFSAIYSTGPQFQCGHSLQLRVLETSSSSEEEGLGLSFCNRRRDETAICPGTILVNVDGYVFVDGMKMTNRLPKLFKNSLLVFESEEELIANNKMRVMITCEDKQVTYDWRLEDQQSEVQQGDHPKGVYCFMFFRENGWKVSVE